MVAQYNNNSSGRPRFQRRNMIGASILMTLLFATAVSSLMLAALFPTSHQELTTLLGSLRSNNNNIVVSAATQQQQGQQKNGINNQILSSLQTHPLLQVPCSISTTTNTPAKPVPTYIDTGAQRTIVTKMVAQKAGLLSKLIPEASTSTTLGCRMMGRLPEDAFQLRFMGEVTIHSPAGVMVVEDSGDKEEITIGLDVLRKQKAVINLIDDELQLTEEKVSIPFLRPRATLFAEEEDETTTKEQVCTATSKEESCQKQ